jgi:hypothetical protein
MSVLWLIEGFNLLFTEKYYYFIGSFLGIIFGPLLIYYGARRTSAEVFIAYLISGISLFLSVSIIGMLSGLQSSTPITSCIGLLLWFGIYKFIQLCRSKNRKIPNLSNQKKQEARQLHPEKKSSIETFEVEKGTAINKIDQKGDFTASDHWERAIAAADNGRRDEALREFGCAIVMSPNRYISEIQPSSNSAYEVWNDAVQTYIQKKDESVVVVLSSENQCQYCEKEMGKNWHYGFESISYAKLVGLKCPDCGLILCKEHSKKDGKELTVCPNCRTEFESMREGPASSSIVEKLRKERRYHGVIKDPSIQGRPVV